MIYVFATKGRRFNLILLLVYCLPVRMHSDGKENNGRESMYELAVRSFFHSNSIIRYNNLNLSSIFIIFQT